MQGLRDAIDARIDNIRNDLFRAASLMPEVRSHQTNPFVADHDLLAVTIEPSLISTQRVFLLRLLLPGAASC
jgi:hypothetical protein